MTTTPNYHADLLHATKETVYYTLSQFPYPSGAGLHVGHASAYTANDIIARSKRMQGFQVINPMGWDSFGLPTENYAMKMKKSASEVTAENIARYKKQCEMMDRSFDWSREFATSSPEYYKRTQRIFTKLFNAGLVYKKDAFVNRCPTCQTVLANDQVIDGRCERCDSEIIQKKHPQRFIKITDYADRLIDDLDTIDRPEETKTAQKYWIGKSQGAEIDFAVADTAADHATTLTVFTTRPDTLYGVTAIVLAPENTTIDVHITPEYMGALTDYRLATSKKTALERQQDADQKSGVFSGVYAIHPLTNDRVPVWFADYVLPDYATGAVMFVPAHDERDWAFAQKHGLVIKDVIAQHYISGNAPVAGKQNTVRRNVLAMLYSSDMTKVLCLDWITNDRKSFIMGGIEEGENAEQAGKREIIEETGYTDIAYIGHVRGEVHCEYYAAHKDVNRYSKEECVMYRLCSEANTGTKEGAEDHHLVWIPVEELETFLAKIPGTMSSNLEFYRRHIATNQAYTGTGVLINSAQFGGLTNTEAKSAIIAHLESLGCGRAKTTYKLRDWSVSRQRYWGSPIPVYYTFDSDEMVPYFEYTDQTWAVKPDMPIVPRNTVQAVIQDVHTKKFLVLQREIDSNFTFVGGGIDGSETAEEAMRREIAEEAGITNIVSMEVMIPEIHRKFFHALKGYNQYTITTCYHVQVDASTQHDIEDKEKAKHTPLWKTAEEIRSLGVDPDDIYMMNMLGGIGDGWAHTQTMTPRYNVYNPHPDKSRRIPHAIPEDQLPVILPLDVADYKPVGKSPLADHATFPYYTKQTKALLLHGYGNTNHDTDCLASLSASLIANGYALDHQTHDYDALQAASIYQPDAHAEIVIGHSTGGYLALKYVEHHPVETLILIAPGVQASAMPEYFVQMATKDFGADGFARYQAFHHSDVDHAAVLRNAQRIVFVFGKKDKIITQEIADYYAKHYAAKAEFIYLDDRGNMGSLDPQANIVEELSYLFPSSAVAHRSLPLFEITPWQAGAPVETRRSAAAIIKHWSEDKYLFIKPGYEPRITVVMGGVESGETADATILRELCEETGYTHARIVRTYADDLHFTTFHPSKKVNRYGLVTLFYCELTDGEQVAREADDATIELVWCTKDEALAQLSQVNIYALKRTLEEDISGAVPATTEMYNQYNPAPHTTTYLRECDTLDTFMCSSFYYIRYADPHNTTQLIDPEIAAKALPVDFYIGGKEHTYGHLLYSRFINKFLYDQGVVPCSEPFQKLFHQGMVLGPDGRKMSKRRGNIITPEDLVSKYGESRGVDVLRTYTMFMGPLEVEKAWSDTAVEGVKRFLDRIERMMDLIQPSAPSADTTDRQLHKAIKGITDDIAKLKFNTAVSKMMVFVNHIYDVKAISASQLLMFLHLLAPFATKLSQEMRMTLGQEGSIHLSSWPVYDPALTVDEEITLPVQINGKMKGTVAVPPGASQEDIMSKLYADERFAAQLPVDHSMIKKVIYVQDKIVNVIV